MQMSNFISMTLKRKILILYASETGTAEVRFYFPSPPFRICVLLTRFLTHSLIIQDIADKIGREVSRRWHGAADLCVSSFGSYPMERLQFEVGTTLDSVPLFYKCSEAMYSFSYK